MARLTGSNQSPGRALAGSEWSRPCRDVAFAPDPEIGGDWLTPETVPGNGSGGNCAPVPAQRAWQCLALRPLPHGQGSLRGAPFRIPITSSA